MEKPKRGRANWDHVKGNSPRKQASEILNKIGVKGVELKLMHVCGTHQDTLVRNGLIQPLHEVGIELVEGPGCPVCVTTTREMEEALVLARNGISICAFGDMTRAPAHTGSLLSAKSEGSDVRVVYSIEDALSHARKNPDKKVVFLGVGFETTVPSTAAILASEPPGNFSVLSFHRLTPPAVIAIAELGKVEVRGLVDPGHVCTITGTGPWEAISTKYGIPQVIAGFEPLDLLMGVFMLVKQIEEGRSQVEIEYTRAVTKEGNVKALSLMERVFDVVDVPWRGFPSIKYSGLAIKPAFDSWNARKIHQDILQELEGQDFPDPEGCQCGSVIRGELSPEECPLFGRACTPSTPVGPCMVSVEGGCAIAYKYGGLEMSPIKSSNGKSTGGHGA